MAEILKTLKASGGDYSSMVTWEATEQTDLVTDGDNHVLECYDDWVNGVDGSSELVIDGWIPDATHDIVIRTPLSERHDGTPTTGFFKAYTANWARLSPSDPYITLEGIMVKKDAVRLGDLVYAQGGGGIGSGALIVRECVLDGFDTTSYAGLYAKTGAIEARNTVIVNCNSGVNRDNFDYLVLENVTIANCAIGISDASTGTGSIYKNVLIYNCTTPVEASEQGTFTYCSTDGSALPSGTGNITSQTFTFTDSANDDFSLTSSDSGARENGTSISGSFTDDIIGTSRPQGTNWDIGAFEAVVGGDTTAPILSSPTGIKTGSTTGSGTVSTDEANGTLYFWATINATETAANIKASGDSQSVTAIGTQNVTFSGLTPSTNYYAHYVHDDAATNESNVVNSSPAFTTDAAAGATLLQMTALQGINQMNGGFL